VDKAYQLLENAKANQLRRIDEKAEATRRVQEAIAQARRADIALFEAEMDVGRAILLLRKNGIKIPLSTEVRSGVRNDILVNGGKHSLQ
jgi:hypothetical protein